MVTLLNQSVAHQQLKMIGITPQRSQKIRPSGKGYAVLLLITKVQSSMLHPLRMPTTSDPLTTLSNLTIW
jgi:hypothetical protein